MTPVFTARRRAEEFAALVEAPSTRGSGDTRYDDLLGLVGTLRDAPPVTARPEFVAGLRERLLAAADTALVPSATTLPTETERLTLPPRRPARERRIAAVVGGLALVGASTSVAMAAQDALPGEALYPVKRALENAQTGLQFAEADKGGTLLASASGRLDEVGALSEGASDEDAAAIADTLDTFVVQASEASDLLLSDYAENDNKDSVSELRDFTAESLDQLTVLEPQVPDGARDELVHAAQVLLDIDAAAQQACPICVGSGITEIPRIFARTPADFTVSIPPGSTAPAQEESGGKEEPGGKAPQEEPSGGAPAVPAELPSSSVPQPSPTLAPQGGNQPTPSNGGPVSELTDQLGNGGSAGTSGPKPGLGDVTDHITDEVTNEVTDKVKEEVTDGVGDVVDGVGDAVDPLTGEVVP